MSLSLSKKRRLRQNQDESSIDESAVENLCLAQTQPTPTVRCGKIQRIHLQNFMCHSNLRIDFHDRVNFIVGNNGSGKSAIMNALVLGLGAKARATNRFGSMKQFIKTGEKSLKIEITFSNAGPQSFERETYGESITVERNITQNGSSTLLVKNQHGEVVSKKLDDLNRILVYHNMQVDNLVFVLNQDSAREFLKELNPHKSYIMFLKATQMELIYEKLYECVNSHKDQQINLKFMKNKINQMREELNEMNNKMEILINLENSKEKLKLLKSELAWAKVHQNERELSEFLKVVENVEKQQAELSHGSESKSALETRFRDQISELENSLAAKKADFQTQNTLLIEMQRKMNEAAKNRSELSLAVDSLQKKKSYYETSLGDIKNHLEQREQTNIDEMKIKNQLKLNKYRQELEEVLNMLATTKRDMKMFIESKEGKKEKEKQLKDHKIEKRTNLDRLLSRISSINPNAKDKLSPFGNETMMLVAEIEKSHREGRFTKKPRGPIGSYIEIPNRKYRDVIESQLSSLVKAFIVDNAKDRHMLESIMRRVCPQMKCTIITTRFQDKVYDVRNGCVKPPSGTCLLMNEIKCLDPNVMNCLIDRLRIEAVLLTDDVNTAEHISSQRENVPVNMYKVIVPQHSLEYLPEPSYRIYSLNIRPARYIQVDAMQHVASLQRETQTLQRQIESIETELKILMSTINEDLQLIDEKRKILQQQEHKQNELKSAIAAIESIDYPEPVEVELLNRELITLRTKISEIDRKISQEKSNLNNAGQEKERSEKEVNEQREFLQSIQKEIDTILQNIDQAQRKLRKIGETYAENQKMLKVLNDKYNALMVEKKAKENELQNLSQNASKLGEIIPTQRDEEDILNEISKLEALPRQRAKITENIDDLRQSISNKTIMIEEENGFYEKAKAAVHMLGQSLKARFDFAKQLKQHMVLILQYCFEYLLKARDFHGSVQVNHTEKTLVLQVVPRDKHLKNAMSSTRALSGGESSYSTVAFLVALWACVDHPFYFLDEYDVFTDIVNRDCLNMLLINEGKDRPDRQYTFLTPQDMAIKSDEIVKIHRMAAPE